MSRKTVLVTGSSRGIGRAIALYYGEKGLNVVINCVNPGHEELLKELAGEIRRFGVDCMPFVGDMGDFQTCETLFREIGKRFGSLDILINNAGVSHIGLLQDMSVEEWNHVISANLNSVFYCCKLAIPLMLAKGGGHILNISSIWGLSGASCEVAYSASKGGMNAFTQALSKELAPSHISVNAIACGVIDTEMNRFLSPEDLEGLLNEIPAGRMGTPKEVAELAFAMTEKSHYLTGQIVALDGGFL